MLTIILMALCFLGAAFAPAYIPAPWGTSLVRQAVRSVLILFGVFFLASTSFVIVPADQVGLVRKIYGVKTLGEGRVIAANGETGYQARILSPGSFTFSPAFRVINDIEFRPVVIVPSGFYGRVVALDGTALREGQIMADAWNDAEFQQMLDAEHFMENGGQKGLQASILKPGRYPLNLNLYQVRIGYIANGKDITGSHDDLYDGTGFHQEQSPLDTSITKIPAGFVGVVRSTVTEKGKACEKKQAVTNDDANGLSATLVPQGCKGIWDTVLQPGDYYLNKDANEVIPVDTRVQALEWRGGYTRRRISLSINGKGDIVQEPSQENIPFDPATANDPAINTKVEGWEVPQELRIQIQVRAENAPIVVAAVGTLSQIEQRIIIPGVRSRVRNVAGGEITVIENDASGKPATVTRPVKVLDLVTQRPALEEAVLHLVEIDARRAGVDVKEIRYGEPLIPPELLVARQRQQLAGQLKLAYEQEQISQQQRQLTEAARATADKQGDLVTSQIALQQAQIFEQTRAANGRAERAFLEEQAKGQTAQAGVLGKESVLQLNELQIVTDLLAKHPDILAHVPMPATLVIGGGGGLEAPSAILGTLLGGQKPAKP